MSKSVQDKIRDQVEFYFSDSNLPGDKFLRTQVASHPEGYVSIETIASFKRMQQLTQNLEDVVSALKNSELLEVDETNKLVRRKTPLADPEILRNRTIYAKGFPKEGTDVDTVTEFFNKHGTVKCVRLRKIPKSKEFKGSVFVEFATEEEAQKASKAQLKYGESELVVMMKKDHEELKKKERDEFQQKKSQKRQEEKRATIAASLHFTENALLKLTVGTEGEVDISKIKEALKPVYEAAATAWIDYEIGSGVAFMKFRQAEQAGECLKAIQEKKPSIGGKEVSVTLVTGEEEREYYLKQEEQKQNARMNKKGKGGKGGFNKGGKKRKQGGEGSEGGENRSPKKQRTEKKQE